MINLFRAKKRYFIVFYVATAKEGDVIGNAGISVKGGYPNQQRVLQQIVEASQEQKYTELTNTAITKIIELSKKDFFDFIRC